MLIKPHKCLMNEEGGSPGGGSAPPAPAQPPAEPAAPSAPGLSADDIKSVVAGEFKTLTDGLFASLRKSGALKPPEPTTPPPQPKKPDATAPADPLAILALRDAFDDATSELKLTKGQRSLLREHVMRVQPGADAVDSMVSDYVSRAGWLSQPETPKAPPTTTPATPAPTAPTVSTAPPASDKGSPAPGGVRPWQAEFSRDPLRMSPAAIAAMNADLGLDKARKQRLDAVAARAEQIRVVVTPERQ